MSFREGAGFLEPISRAASITGCQSLALQMVPTRMNVQQAKTTTKVGLIDAEERPPILVGQAMLSPW
jgi:hypothetical protein